jgi:hypothetical protein
MALNGLVKTHEENAEWFFKGQLRGNVGGAPPTPLKK